jgi:hypothetical protein
VEIHRILPGSLKAGYLPTTIFYLKDFMHLANLTTAALKKTALFIFITFSYTFASAQENSPYSRYGMGDIVPSQNIVSRSMGGISAGFIDSMGFLPYSQSINLTNPASLGSLGSTTLFDFAGEIDIRTLKSNTSPDKYKSTNTIVSYLQLAFPITPKRLAKKGLNWGIAFGLRPVTRVNYKIQANKRISDFNNVNIDSVSTLFEGSGGVSQANFSTGIKIKNFSFGISTGYAFGNRQTSTQLRFVNDSVPYKFSNSATEANFGGLFLNLGAQYAIRLKDKSVLRLGASANLQQNLKAKRNVINETFDYASDGSIIAIDTVTAITDQEGTIKLPAVYNVGFTYTTPHWMLGADIDVASWSQFRYYGEKDAVQNNMKLHIGGQYYPATERTPTNQYWKFVKYRAGLYYGSDYVKLGTSSKPEYGVTFGAGLPLTSFQRLRFGDFVMLNTGVEIGQRGNKTNLSLRENIFRINIGISMTAAWFQKRKYD